MMRLPSIARHNQTIIRVLASLQCDGSVISPPPEDASVNSRPTDKPLRIVSSQESYCSYAQQCTSSICRGCRMPQGNI